MASTRWQAYAFATLWNIRRNLTNLPEVRGRSSGAMWAKTLVLRFVSFDVESIRASANVFLVAAGGSLQEILSLALVSPKAIIGML